MVASLNDSHAALFFSYENVFLYLVLFSPVIITLFYFCTMQEFEILSQIRQLQASCCNYSLPVNTDITSWLQAHTLLTDQER